MRFKNLNKLRINKFSTNILKQLITEFYAIQPTNYSINMEQ